LYFWCAVAERDHDDCPDNIDDHILHHLHRIEAQMTEFANDQAHLDADVASLGQVTASIETEIANLKNQPAAAGLDFTGLDAALGTLQGVAPSAPSPAPAPAPAPEPAPAPVVDPTPAPADPNAPTA
jgi:hypothetical protein